MAPVDSPEALHCAIIRHIVDTGHAPSLQRLAELAKLTEDRALSILKKLESIHGVILVPNSSRIWSIHPFALNPTSFWVSTADATRGWWANCAWCALGIGAAIQQDLTITTSDGGEGDLLKFSVVAGRPSRIDLLMNFPYPPERWWDNSFAPCANILFFSRRPVSIPGARVMAIPMAAFFPSILPFASPRFGSETMRLRIGSAKRLAGPTRSSRN